MWSVKKSKRENGRTARGAYSDLTRSRTVHSVPNSHKPVNRGEALCVTLIGCPCVTARFGSPNRSSDGEARAQLRYTLSTGFRTIDSSTHRLPYSPCFRLPVSIGLTSCPGMSSSTHICHYLKRNSCFYAHEAFTQSPMCVSESC